MAFHRDHLTMRWRDAVFAHWRVPPGVVADRLPDGLGVATVDGDAWLGIVAFRMADVRPRGLPIGRSFGELNLRTYVARDGERGVYFLSLDAGDALGVAVARLAYRLPYYRADTRVRAADGAVTVASQRRHPGAPPATFDATCVPEDETFRPASGSVASFLTENYVFFAGRERLYRGEIDHDPWRIRPATLTVRTNSLFDANGFDRPAGEPTVHYSPGATVTAGRPRRVE